MKVAGPSTKDFKLEHVDTILANLNKELEKIEGRGLIGLLAAAAHIFDDMDKTSPRIPIDTGNLRASFFIVASKGGGDQSKGTGEFKGDDAADMKNEKGQVVGAVESAVASFRQPAVGLGFTANYATFVHENLDANFAGKKAQTGKLKDARRSGAGPRFFSTALERNTGKIIEIVAKYAKIQ